VVVRILFTVHRDWIALANLENIAEKDHLADWSEVLAAPPAATSRLLPGSTSMSMCCCWLVIIALATLARPKIIITFRVPNLALLLFILLPVSCESSTAAED
jgi:hypothetical protein